MKKTIYCDQDFKRLIEGNYYYVDKTKVIEDLIMYKKDGTALFPRPRRFGKSLFMSTLDYFFNIEKNSKHLFKGLYIEKSKVFKEHLNKYPVIHLDFKDLRDNNYDSFYTKFKSLMSSAYKSKKYIYDRLEEYEKKKFDRILNEEGVKEEYEEALVKLSEWLYSYYDKEVIILIDEYDAPINASYVNRYYEKLMELFRPIFSRTFKGNNALKLGIMTGVLRIGGESFFGVFNNPDIYDVMSSKYNDYFGFTKSETKEMLEYFDLEYSSEVSEYYDGYNFNGVHVYNPWSIANYAKNKELKPYWINTGSNELIRSLLTQIDEEEKRRKEELVKGNSISFKYNEKLSFSDFKSNNFTCILNLLLVSGYLTLDRKEEDIYYYKIPNKEVLEDFMNMISYIMFGEDIRNGEYILGFVDGIKSGDKELAEKYLNQMLRGVSYLDNKEAFYHGYIMSLFLNFLSDSKYRVESNHESGEGRYDVCIKRIDNTLGIIIEFKVSKTKKNMEVKAKDGIKQIKKNSYSETLLRDKVKDIKEYVIVFHGNSAIVR